MPLEFDDINEDLEMFGVNVSDALLKEKCVSLCLNCHINGEELALHWLSFAASHGYEEITVDNIIDFEREILKREVDDKNSVSTDPGRSVDNDPCKISTSTTTLDDDLLVAYDASPVIAKKSHNAPSFKTNEGKTGLPLSQSIEDLKCLAPSLSQSPLSQKSQKYFERSNAGHVVCSYGSDNISKNKAVECEVRQLPCCTNETFVSSYKFMFEKLRDCADVLDDAIFEFGSRLLESGKAEVDEFSSLKRISNEPIWCLGRICCDSVGRLNSASVLLQGDREFGHGDFVKLDLSHLASYSIFPGQIVAIEGINSTGDCLTAHQIINGCSPSERPAANVYSSSFDGVVDIMIVSGPYTTRDNLLFEPLMDLLMEVVKNPPHVLLLLGPLLDASHSCIEDPLFEDSFDSVLMKLFEKIGVAFNSISTQLFVVASHSDVCCIPVYPTPPVISALEKSNSLVRVLPDPCLLDINGISLGATTLDIPLHLSREEINHQAKTADRLSRLSEHLLLQQSFYPLYPPPEDTPFDIRRADMYSHLPFTPHLMVTPSDLKGYLKEVTGCLFVNPDRLTRGNSGGSYCRLSVDPGSPDCPRPKIKAQIIKI